MASIPDANGDLAKENSLNTQNLNTIQDIKTVELYADVNETSQGTLPERNKLPGVGDEEENKSA